MKISINIVTHHKPFLITASLISLALQKFDNFDLHIIFIKGDGTKKKYQKYDKLKKKNNKYSQLSKSSNKILSILKNFKKDKIIHIFENDHALDSGAWLKFINKKVWKKYDYNFFLMEGFIFKDNNSLKDLFSFLKHKKPDAVMLGSEKIFTTEKTMNRFALSNKKNLTDNYHQDIINKTFKSFCKHNAFKKVYLKWHKTKILNDINNKNSDISINFPHKEYFSNFIKCKLFLKFILVKKKFYNPFTDLIFFNKDNFRYLLPRKFFFKKEFKFGSIIAHIEKSPFIYVNGCQHIFSNKILNKINNLLILINIKKILNYPFVATALEFIWGMLPKTLGFKKWHVDCLHRPRKNFLTYEWEDTAFFMKKYLEIYSNHNIKIKLDNNNLKISNYSEKFEFIKKNLNKNFFE